MWGNSALWIGLLALAPAAFAVPLRAEAPLSAIDWLSQSVATPAPSGKPQPQGGAPTPAPGQPAWPPATIGAAPLAPETHAQPGLVAPERSGLPADLWGKSPSDALARQIAEVRSDTLPAIQSLLTSILVARLQPPADGDPQGTLFLARVDKLLDIGALDPALALLEDLDAPTPEEFRRWFDISLLVGQEDRACEVMVKTPHIAPTLQARIFCLAREGDWQAAAISLRTGQALGLIAADEADLLARFLDPELFEGEPPLPLPPHPSPLSFRMLEAIDQPVPTATLPLAFAQADLRSNTGWKARIEAGERLARTGAIPPNRLLGLYTEQRPAASGGVWNRAAAVQGIEAALSGGDKAALGAALPGAWHLMQDQGLEVPFAQLFGPAIAGARLDGALGKSALTIGLLSDDARGVARNASWHTDKLDPALRFQVALATASDLPPEPTDPATAAIRDAFAGLPLDERFTTLLDDGRQGEAVLRALTMLSASAAGDQRDTTAALALLRHVGLDRAARRIAAELLILHRET